VAIRHIHTTKKPLLRWPLAGTVPLRTTPSPSPLLSVVCGAGWAWSCSCCMSITMGTYISVQAGRSTYTTIPCPACTLHKSTHMLPMAKPDAGGLLPVGHVSVQQLFFCSVVPSELDSTQYKPFWPWPDPRPSIEGGGCTLPNLSFSAENIQCATAGGAGRPEAVCTTSISTERGAANVSRLQAAGQGGGGGRGGCLLQARELAARSGVSCAVC
jgi:hypothetical protein